MSVIRRWLRQARRRALAWAGLETRPSGVVRRTRLDGHPHPVLLLHGFFSTRRTLDVLERRLRRDGYGVFTLDLGGWRRLRGVITLGTPFHGTRRAWLGLPVALVAPSLPQLLPGSSFLRRLEEGPWPPEVPLTSLWSRRDTLAPWPSALLDPQGSPAVRNVEVDCQHAEFLTRAAVYAALRRELARIHGPDQPVVAARPLRGGRSG